MKVKEILEKLISFNTVNDKQNIEITEWIEAFLKDKGFRTSKIKNDKSGKYNLIAKYGDKKSTGVSFFGHTDTVPASGKWKYNPFSLTVEGDRMYGLGACDMKGGIASFLAVIQEMDLSSLNKNIELFFTFDEEKNMSGIKNLCEKKEIESDIIILGEPTNNLPVIAHKGILAVNVIFKGKSSHGSLPSKGVNAIQMASKFIENLTDYNNLHLSKLGNNIFNPPCATMNIGKISGGNAINIVPEKCILQVEWRLIEKYQKENILKNIQKVIKENNIEADVSIDLSLDPFCSSSKLINEIKSVLNVDSVFAENYATEASIINGSNVLIIGPGLDNIHMSNEFVTKDSISKSMEIYRKIIEKYCLVEIL